MGQSYKNTSSGGEGSTSKGANYLPIGENKAHTPPAGSSNSYEKIRNKIDAKDRSSLAKMPYTREKMANK